MENDRYNLEIAPDLRVTNERTGAGRPGRNQVHLTLTYICLLRAVNVGGTGKLPMAELSAICSEAGFVDLHRQKQCSAAQLFNGRTVRRALEALAQSAGKSAGVLLRTLAEKTEEPAPNSLPDAAPNRTVVIPLDQTPPADTRGIISGPRDEQVVPGIREMYVHGGRWRGGSAGTEAIRST